MNSKNFLYLILGVGVAGAGGSSLVACSSVGDISRDDPDYSNYHVGTNYKDGRRITCKYKDATVIRQASGGFAKDAPSRTIKVLEPGLTESDRSSTLAAAKEKIIAQIKANIRYERQFTQIESCDLECQEEFDFNRNGDSYDSASVQDASSGSPIMAPSPESREGADQVSTTNNQVEGVDEADFIKNDNKYMYVLSGQNVKIIDAWPAASAKVISTTNIAKGKPTKIFLGDNKLVVYSAIGGGNQKECTYGYDCVPRGDGSATHVTVLNIADRTNPVVERELDLSGSLIAARKVGNAVHSVVYDPPAEERLQQLAYGNGSYNKDRYRCLDRRDDFDAIVRAYDEGVASRIEAVRNVSDAGPSIADQGAKTEPTFRKSASSDGSYLTVASFGIAGEGVTAETMAGKPGFVYAGSDSLYISVPHDRSNEQGWYNEWSNVTYASEVYKYAIGSAPTQTKYVASGMVKGTVLNQFAMDQWGGHLRIATTSGRAFDPSAHST
ncbi:MAG: beta-propeller domain-containing protein, partial [Polyangiaceae bacterium]|nr:beta-propeller domain-containing protein [Polyangiaceae bacterium]